MTQYKTFWQAYQAKHPDSKFTPAGQTWTPQNLQNLANAYSALNPTWTPPAAQNAALPQPVKPVKFDPLLDPSYAASYSAAQNGNQHAQNAYDYGIHNIGQSYGYDPTGALITGGADLNPYAQAAVLKRNYDNSVRGTTNSYAAQGQLYSGALKNAQAANDYGYGLSSDQLQRAARNAYNANASALQSTQDQNAAQLAALLGPALQNFLAQQAGG